MNSNKKGNKKMTVVKATFKIACCYEVENNIMEVISSDEFADRMQEAILELSDTAVNPTDICIQTPDDSLVFEYSDNKEYTKYVGKSVGEFHDQNCSGFIEKAVKKFYAKSPSEQERSEAEKAEKPKGKKK